MRLNICPPSCLDPFPAAPYRFAPYERDDFLVVKGNIPEVDLDRYRKHFKSLCTGEVLVPPSVQVVRDLGSVRQGGGSKKTPSNLATINKLQNLEAELVIFGYASHPNIIELLPAFTGISSPTWRSGPAVSTVAFTKPCCISSG